MARKSVLTALLLPLPFAALPLLSVLVGHFDADTGGLAVSEPTPIQRQLDEMLRTNDAYPSTGSLTYGITDPSLSSCDPGSTSTIDG